MPATLSLERKVRGEIQKLKNSLISSTFLEQYIHLNTIYKLVFNYVFYLYIFLFTGSNAVVIQNRHLSIDNIYFLWESVYFYFSERLAMQPNSIIGSSAICVSPWSLQVYLCWGFFVHLIIVGVTKQTTKDGALS